MNDELVKVIFVCWNFVNNFHSGSDSVLATIQSGAFKGAVLNGFTFPKSLETLGSSAFEKCTIKGELNFGATSELNSLYYYTRVFAEADISKLVITQHLTNLYQPSQTDEDSLSNCDFYESNIGTLDLGSTKFVTIPSYSFYRVKITSQLILPAVLENVANNAFQRARIPSLDFTNTKINMIGSYAFQYILTLTEVKNLKVENIGTSAFEGCINAVISNIQILGSGQIGGNAFKDCFKLGGELEILPASKTNDDGLIYTTIGGGAFQNSGIRTINIAHYIESIGGSAFKNCTSLTGSGSLSLKEIGANAFEDDKELKLTSINATTIQGSAFKNCHKLGAEIQLYYYGNIMANAFENCDDLKKLTILFHESDGLVTKDKQDFKNDLGQIGKEAFYRSGLSGSLTIPITINTIGKNAFAHTKLTSLTIDESTDKKNFLTINDKAFYHSKIGGNLVIPFSTLYVGEHAFANCPITGLEVHGNKYDFTDPTGLSKTKTYLGDYAFYSCKIAALTFTNEDIEFGTKTFRSNPIGKLSLGSITSIPLEAFYGMSTINTAVTIPDTVTFIGARAFSGCTLLPSVTFNENSKLDGQNLKSGVFYGCSNLETIKLPFGLTKIDDETFYKCRRLSSIEIRELITSIGDFAFYGCINLKGPLTFPIEFKSIGESAFQGCDQLSGSLEFPDAFSSIDYKAFMGCKSLNGHVTFGRSISTIDGYAFRDCSGFTEGLTFPEDLYNYVTLTINDGAFYGCSGFTGDLILPKGTTLSESVFQGCSGFNGKLDLQDITSVPKSAFQGCSGFTGQIPTKDLTKISEHAFHGCSGFNGSLDLTSLDLEVDNNNNENLNIKEYAFCGCRGLNGPLILPAALNEVNEHAFDGCSGLTGTLDCSKFTHIHKYAFAGCSGLTGSLDFEDKLTNIDQYAFSGCSGFSDRLTFRIGEDKLDIDQCAFEGCKGFKDGTLSFIAKNNEENFESGGIKGPTNRYAPYYRYDYFLKIGNKAFDETKFKNIYYLGRFEPDCDYDIGISQIKGIHTSSNYANKTFCNYPLHSSKLSGGAIAGIVIACVVVVAAIVVLIVFLIMRAKKNKDNSENEVEMNGDP